MTEDFGVNQLIQKIPERVLEEKWKDECHQVVLKGENFFYKIYEETDFNIFYSIIRNKLAEIYNKRGIDWNIVTVEKNGLVYDLEQREYLSVIDDTIPFDNVLDGFTSILDELGKSLELDSVLKQLQAQDERFFRATRILILRDCVNKNMDYAIKNNQVYLLDDTDWFLCFVDENGDLIDDFSQLYLDVSTSYGDFTLTSLHYVNNQNIDPNDVDLQTNVPNELVWQWVLRPQKYVDKKKIFLISDLRKKMFSQNAKRIDTVSKSLLLEEKKMNYEEERLLYSNNLGRKTFQWELWQMCNSFCAFCVKDHTNITMADCTTKQACDIQIGDEILGFEGEGENIHVVKTTVLNIFTKEYQGDLYNEFFTPDHPVLDIDRKTYVPIKDSTSHILVSIGIDQETGELKCMYNNIEEPGQKYKKPEDGIVYNFETGTGNFIAGGIICHNCYLGAANKNTTKEIQLRSIQHLNDAINNLDFNVYNNISIIGGEFFQGQMKDPEINKAFFDLMTRIGQLYIDKKIGSIWLTCSLTIGDQEDLYKLVKMYDEMGIYPREEYGASGFWLCTSWDQEGRFHNPKMKENWEYHMKNIKKEYPWVKFNTTIVLSEPFCLAYINNDFDLTEFKKEFSTTVFFKQCGVWQEELDDAALNPEEDFEEFWLGAKRRTNERVKFTFFPHRDVFCNFLKEFVVRNPSDYDRLFNIKYRADELHRNFNDGEENSIARHKDSALETDCGLETHLNKCGHIFSYAPYVDGNECCVCDRNAIADMFC